MSDFFAYKLLSKKKKKIHIIFRKKKNLWNSWNHEIIYDCLFQFLLYLERIERCSFIEWNIRWLKIFITVISYNYLHNANTMQHRITCYVKHDTEQLNVFQYLSIHIFASVEENERRKERKIEKKIYEKYLIFLR